MIPALAIGTAWVIVACAIAPKLGRAIKHADPGEDQPNETALMRAEFDRIVGAEVWFGGVLNNDRHLHGGAA